MLITAAVALGAGQAFVLREVELDDPRDDEILVRIVGVGVCHTDIMFQQGGLIASPAVFRHER